MSFYDRDGNRLQIGDPVTLMGEHLDPRYLDGANGVIERFGDSLIHVAVTNLKDLTRVRGVSPKNLRKGHHGIDPGQRYREFSTELWKNTFMLSMKNILEEAEHKQIITEKQRLAIEDLHF